MYDIEKLEKKWEAYNKKRHKPKYIVLITFLLLVLGIYLFRESGYIDKIQKSATNDMIYANNHSTETHAISSGEKSVEREVDNLPATADSEKRIGGAEDTLPASEGSEKKVAGKADKLPPVPAKEIYHKVDEAGPKLVSENPFALAKNEPILEDVESLGSRDSDKETLPKTTPAKKVHINIIEIADVVAYKDIEDRFYETREIEDSLFLARSYFNKGNYKKAEYWALQTNKVDDSIEESWLIFAKSKLKLGYKNEAIKILELYLKKYDSREAGRLLEKLK